jgi:molybdenum cofactor cytidylyltransferase
MMNKSIIGAVVLAAGESKRMGKPKLVLPWKDTTVVGQVVETLFSAGIHDVTIVTGGHRDLVENALSSTPVRLVHNQNFHNDNMLESVKVGIKSLPEDNQAILIVLADQPRVKERTIRSICNEYHIGTFPIVFPSWNMRRGHPWLLDRSYFDELLAMEEGLTLRDFLKYHTDVIHYLEVDDPSILQDIDTLEQYHIQNNADNNR